VPQTTDELRALMGEWFGDEISDAGPTDFLLARGWAECGVGYWHPPVSHHNVSREELACLRFLVEEWDHDYVVASYYPEEKFKKSVA